MRRAVWACVAAGILWQCSGCGEASQTTDDELIGDQHALDTVEMSCFDFRGFTVVLDTTDERQLLRFDETDVLDRDRQQRHSTWDGQVWGSGRSNFAAMYASFTASPEQSDWSRFDAAPDAPPYPETRTSVIGRADTFGWMGLSHGSIYTTTDVEEASPLRASADVIGRRLLPFLLDAEAEFIDRYVEDRVERFERQAHTVDGVTSTRLSSWSGEDQPEVRHILHIYDNEGDQAERAFRLIHISPNRGTSRVRFVRFRPTTCEESVVPRTPDELEQAYPGLIDPELVEPYPVWRFESSDSGSLPR